MNADDWARKCAAYLHDPPSKFDAFFYRAPDGGGGHNTLARKLIALLRDDDGAEQDQAAEKANTKAIPDADHWATSADRPQLGWGKQVWVPWRTGGWITHPLDAAALKLLPLNRGSLPPSLVNRQVLRVVEDGLQRALQAVPSVDRPKATFWWLWRGLLRTLGEHPPDGVDPDLWARYVALGPADTRTPDHPLRDHVRLTAALAWGPNPEIEATHPWLFTLTVGPIGTWIREARTTRDLWVASMILSEVSFAAMGPIIELHGPDAILYPDLAFNTRFDREVARRPGAEALLSPTELATRTRAALIPNHWTALLRPLPSPDDVASLGRRCQQAGLERWHSLAREVRVGFLKDALDGQPEARCQQVETQWREQCERAGELYVHWAARPWQPPSPEKRADPVPPPALPAQTDRARRHVEWLKDSAPRRLRFGNLVPVNDLLRYEKAAAVYTTLRPLKCQPGFDYAVTSHALNLALGARGKARSYPAAPLAGGDACTACGTRAALGTGGGPANQQRRAASDLWSRIAERYGWDASGEERLCGVCATRRFLIPPWSARLPAANEDGALARFHRIWASENDEDRNGDRNRLRLPMPSTSAVAAGPYLAALYANPGTTAARGNVAAAAKKADWPETFFARSLHIVGGSLPDVEERFSRLEPSMLYDGPRLAEHTARRSKAGKVIDATGREAQSADVSFGDAIRALREAGKTAGVGDHPSTRFAVVAVDGDNLGKLFLGDATAVGAKWKDVLHPQAVQQIEASTDDWAQAWRGLLDDARLMGPSLHAFLNRTVTTFANRIVPWVVEREFGGRLVYAGGDDVLALAPADHALGIAARLQQLWSAAWILDTEPARSAWTSGERWNPTSDQQRFRVYHADADRRIHPESPEFEAHAWTGERPPSVTEGEVVAMLGHHQSLSAGIAYAHFKTPLQGVIAAAREVLDTTAKERAGRAACAEVVFTRNGEKFQSVFQWAHNAAHDVKVLREDFRAGRIPSRMPYKLAEQGPALQALAGRRDRQVRMAKGLVTAAFEEPDPERAYRIARHWLEGARVSPDFGIGNLLLARALASEEEP